MTGLKKRIFSERPVQNHDQKKIPENFPENFFREKNFFSQKKDFYHEKVFPAEKCRFRDFWVKMGFSWRKKFFLGRRRFSRGSWSEGSSCGVTGRARWPGYILSLFLIPVSLFGYIPGRKVIVCKGIPPEGGTGLGSNAQAPGS